MPKRPAKWSLLAAGDIVSFSYQPDDKSKPAKTTTILVLNPKYPKTLKSGEKKFYINALKLEESNIKVLRSRDEAWTLLSTVGWVTIRSLKDKIFKVELHSKFVGTYGAKEKLYTELKKSPIGKRAQYRTYDREVARKKSVFYEPLDFPKQRIELLVVQEQQQGDDKKGPPVAEDIASGERAVGGDEKVVDGTILGDIKELLG